MDIDLVVLEKLYGKCKLYGPYKRCDGRKHVVLFYGKKNSNKTISYPKLLVELSIGRVLIEPETVDHIDGNITNDNLDNLRIVSRSVNARTGLNASKHQKYITDKCLKCGVEFSQQLNHVKNNLKRNKLAGRFCSKECGASYIITGPLPQRAEGADLKSD